MIKHLNATIDTKDTEIEALHEEIRQLQMNAYSQKEAIQSAKEEKKELEHRMSIGGGTLPIQSKQKVKAGDNELKLQQTVDQQLQIIGDMKLEKDEIEKDRQQLLAWNRELQKKLDHFSIRSAAQDTESMPSGLDQKRNKIVKPINKNAVI